MDNLAILITGYNNERGYSDIISCSDSNLVQEIKNNKVVLKDYRYSLNIIAESEHIYSIGFTKDWKVFTVYEAYAWSARKVMIGLSLFIRKGYGLQGDDNNNVKVLLDQLKNKYIKFKNYQLAGTIALTVESTRAFNVKEGEVSNGSFHLSQCDKGKEGKGAYRYQHDNDLNAIFNHCYAAELQGYREVYLLNKEIKYIEPLVPVLPHITPKPISKEITIKFYCGGQEVPPYKLSQIKVNGHSASDKLCYTVEEHGNGLEIEVDDKNYEQQASHKYSSLQLINRPTGVLKIDLQKRPYTYTIVLLNESTKKPVGNGFLVSVEYEKQGQKITEEKTTGYSGQVILSRLHYNQALRITPTKYTGTDKNFDSKSFLTRNVRVDGGQNRIEIQVKQIIAQPDPPKKPSPANSTTLQKNTKSTQTHDLGQRKWSSARLFVKFMPEDAKPKPENIDIRIKYRGMETLVIPSDIIIDNNKFSFQVPEEFDQITIGLRFSRKYEIEKEGGIEVLPKNQVQNLIDQNWEKTIFLKEQKKGFSFSSIFGKRVFLLLGGVLLLVLLSWAISVAVGRGTGRQDLSALLQTTKVGLEQRLAEKRIKFGTEEEGLNDLISKTNEEIKKNDLSLVLSKFGVEKSDKRIKFLLLTDSIDQRISRLSTNNLKDTVMLIADLDSAQLLLDELLVIRSNLLSAVDNAKSTAGEKAVQKAKKDQSRSIRDEFKVYKNYIRGSIEDVQKIKTYTSSLEGSQNRDKFINAGVDRDLFINTLALARKRVDIKSFRFIIVCFTSKDPDTCDTKTKQRIVEGDEFSKAVNQLENWANDPNALLDNQRAELKEWLARVLGNK